MYRYINEKGEVYFSDQVPPHQIPLGHERLSPISGRPVDIVEKAKTKEEQEFDERLAELRKAEAKLIERQQTHDKVLLATYRTKNDLISSIETKMHTLETQKTALEGDLTRLIRQMEEQQKNAAAFERNGEKVPQELHNHIKSSQQQIVQAREAITDHTQKMAQIKKENDSNIERFLFLTQTNTPGPKGRLASIKEASELGLFYCENDRQCNKAWEIGQTFVHYNSTTPADIFNDKLIMNRPPATDDDLSLSLSKIPLPNDEYQLFLDIRCRDSLPGKALCASQRVRDIRSAFRPYVNEALLRAAQQ
ncbi:MAG: hypothetical protein ABL919_10080 [Methylococcales bacterium]|nr:hypothetical protein [Methylococcaceae bacterium]